MPLGSAEARTIARRNLCQLGKAARHLYKAARHLYNGLMSVRIIASPQTWIEGEAVRQTASIIPGRVTERKQGAGRQSPLNPTVDSSGRIYYLAPIGEEQSNGVDPW